jgi:hypothetical protein
MAEGGVRRRYREQRRLKTPQGKDSRRGRGEGLMERGLERSLGKAEGGDEKQE